jgi:hypothetical protein
MKIKVGDIVNAYPKYSEAPYRYVVGVFKRGGVRFCDTTTLDPRFDTQHQEIWEDIQDCCNYWANDQGWRFTLVKNCKEIPILTVNPKFTGRVIRD